MTENLSLSDDTMDEGSDSEVEPEVETVLTCQGSLSDPLFHEKLVALTTKLKRLLRTGVFRVVKVEPWNSVRVTFSIPRDAAQRLKNLAQHTDGVLRELGILSVQVDEENVILLKIAGTNNEAHEIVLKTNDNIASSTPSAASNESGASDADVQKNVTQLTSVQNQIDTNMTVFNQIASGDVNHLFRSPNVVAPNSDPLPFQQPRVVGARRPANTYPSMQQTQSISSSHLPSSPVMMSVPVMHPQQRLHSSSNQVYANSQSVGYVPQTSISVSSVARMVASSEVALSSPLLVNLLQSGGSTAADAQTRMLSPPLADGPVKKKRKPRRSKEKHEDIPKSVSPIAAVEEPLPPGMRHIINPLTGHLEPVANEDSESSPGAVDRLENSHELPVMSPQLRTLSDDVDPDKTDTDQAEESNESPPVLEKQYKVSESLETLKPSVKVKTIVSPSESPPRPPTVLKITSTRDNLGNTTFMVKARSRDVKSKEEKVLKRAESCKDEPKLPPIRIKVPKSSIAGLDSSLVTNSPGRKRSSKERSHSLSVERTSADVMRPKDSLLTSDEHDKPITVTRMEDITEPSDLSQGVDSTTIVIGVEGPKLEDESLRDQESVRNIVIDPDLEAKSEIRVSRLDNVIDDLSVGPGAVAPTDTVFDKAAIDSISGGFLNAPSINSKVNSRSIPASASPKSTIRSECLSVTNVANCLPQSARSSVSYGEKVPELKPENIVVSKEEHLKSSELLAAECCRDSGKGTSPESERDKSPENSDKGKSPNSLKDLTELDECLDESSKSPTTSIAKELWLGAHSQELVKIAFANGQQSLASSHLAPSSDYGALESDKVGSSESAGKFYRTFLETLPSHVKLKGMNNMLSAKAGMENTSEITTNLAQVTGKNPKSFLAPSADYGVSKTAFQNVFFSDSSESRTQYGKSFSSVPSVGSRTRQLGKSVNSSTLRKSHTSYNQTGNGSLSICANSGGDKAENTGYNSSAKSCGIASVTTTVPPSSRGHLPPSSTVNGPSSNSSTISVTEMVASILNAYSVMQSTAGSGTSVSSSARDISNRHPPPASLAHLNPASCENGAHVHPKHQGSVLADLRGQHLAVSSSAVLTSPLGKSLTSDVDASSGSAAMQTSTSAACVSSTISPRSRTAFSKPAPLRIPKEQITGPTQVASPVNLASSYLLAAANLTQSVQASMSLASSNLFGPLSPPLPKKGGGGKSSSSPRAKSGKTGNKRSSSPGASSPRGSHAHQYGNGTSPRAFADAGKSSATVVSHLGSINHATSLIDNIPLPSISSSTPTTSITSGHASVFATSNTLADACKDTGPEITVWSYNRCASEQHSHHHRVPFIGENNILCGSQDSEVSVSSFVPNATDHDYTPQSGDDLTKQESEEVISTTIVVMSPVKDAEEFQIDLKEKTEPLKIEIPTTLSESPSIDPAAVPAETSKSTPSPSVRKTRSTSAPSDVVSTSTETPTTNSIPSQVSTPTVTPRSSPRSTKRKLEPEEKLEKIRLVRKTTESGSNELVVKQVFSKPPETEERTKISKRKCSENAAELIKACIGYDEKPKPLKRADDSEEAKLRAVQAKEKISEDQISQPDSPKQNVRPHRSCRRIYAASEAESSDDEIILSELVGKKSERKKRGRSSDSDHVPVLPLKPQQQQFQSNSNKSRPKIRSNSESSAASETGKDDKVLNRKEMPKTAEKSLRVASRKKQSPSPVLVAAEQKEQVDVSSAASTKRTTRSSGAKVESHPLPPKRVRRR